MQTALQRMSEKHLDFEIQAANTIRPPHIEYTKTSEPLVPVDMPLLVIRKHIPRQSDIDKIVKSIETRVIHRLELPIQAQICKSLSNINAFLRHLPLHNRQKITTCTKAQNCIHAEALNYVVINNFLFRIET